MNQQSHAQGVKQSNTRSYIQHRQRPSSDVQQTQTNYPEDSYGDEEYDDVWPSRMPTSVRRYRSDVRTGPGRFSGDVQSFSQQDNRVSNPGRTGSTIPPRRTATQSISVVQPPRRRTVDMEPVSPRWSGDLAVERGGRRFHWLVFVGLAMIGMLLGWMLLTTFMNWWQVTQDDLHYGRPRTSQYDHVVGHGDSAANPSHFIALNLNRHIEVIECPAGDCSKARVLMGPILVGPGQDLAPVTLTFKDVNGGGKLDLIVNVQDSHYVFINENGTFRPAHPGDSIQI